LQMVERDIRHPFLAWVVLETPVSGRMPFVCNTRMSTSGTNQTNLLIGALFPENPWHGLIAPDSTQLPILSHSVSIVNVLQMS
jgi:hypothetical protein